MITDPAVAVAGVVVRRGGRDVVDHVDLVAGRARVTALLGPNGAGKTTLIRCCTGLVTPDAGTVRVLGRSPSAAAAAGVVGVMPQSTGAWSGIRAGELLRYLAGLAAHPLPVDLLVDRLGLGEVLRTPYRRLSGGQQQAVNLAGAIVGRPELVLLDEPTSGMDPHARRSTWALVGDLRAAGVSVLLTTHDLDEATTLADDVVVLDRGRVVLTGTVDGLTAGGSTLEELFLAHTHAATDPSTDAAQVAS